MSAEDCTKLFEIKIGKPNLNARGKKRTEEQKLKMSLAHKGKKAWNKGLNKYTNESLKGGGEKQKITKNKNKG